LRCTDLFYVNKNDNIASSCSRRFQIDSKQPWKKNQQQQSEVMVEHCAPGGKHSYHQAKKKLKARWQLQRQKESLTSLLFTKMANLSKGPLRVGGGIRINVKVPYKRHPTITLLVVLSICCSLLRMELHHRNGIGACARELVPERAVLLFFKVRGEKGCFILSLCTGLFRATKPKNHA